MRTVFIHFESVMQPLGRMTDAAGTIQWLYQLAQSLSTHADVRVVLFGEWTETFPHRSGLTLVHALGKQITATASAQVDKGPIEGYLSRHPDVDDFVVLADVDTELPAPLLPHRIAAEPAKGLWDISATELRLWLNGKARQRDTAVFGSRQESDPAVKLFSSPRALKRWPEPVIATVAFVIEEFELVRLVGPGDLTLSIGERTAGIDWRQLRPGQRVECEVEGEHATRVVRARLLPSTLAAPAPNTDGYPT